jgi:hypothetical protein
MVREVNKIVNGEEILFIVSTAPAHQAIHINVKVHNDSLNTFIKFHNKELIYENMALEIARKTNRRAHLMFCQTSTGNEWQGQFNFD